MQGFTGPLWLDESGTGAFAAETSLSGLTEQARNDSNAPLYYYVIWFWAKAFGVSNLSLRIPSLMFTAAAPLIAWAGLHRSRPMLACVWAALLALWLMGIVHSGYARCYALLLCLSVATAVSAVRAYDAPTPARAFGWASAACLMTLTHYFAGPLALVQGLVLLARYRGRWRSAWPATLAFLPVFVWIAWHAPRLAAFARPDAAWYDLLELSALPAILSAVLGAPLSKASLVAALTVGRLMALRPEGCARPPRSLDRAAIATGLASLISLGLVLVLAALRPSFTLRYLTPFAPGILLLVATLVVAASRSAWQPLAVLIVGSMVGVSVAVAGEESAAGRVYTFEAASAWIAESHPTRLVFFWDNPLTVAAAPKELDAIGGFFLRRAGLVVEVDPVYAISGADMSPPVLATAGTEGAILWIYDTAVHHTSAILHPPNLAHMGGLECRNFGIYNIGVVACRPIR